jgi:hypothetical protein
MAFDWQKLTEITYIANSAGAVFTNPAATKSYIRLIIIHNNNTTVEQIKLYNVPDSTGAVGTAGDANIFFNVAVQPSETVVLGSDLLPVPGIILTDENDTIQGVTTTASKVTIQIFGGQE